MNKNKSTDLKVFEKRKKLMRTQFSWSLRGFWLLFFCLLSIVTSAFVVFLKPEQEGIEITNELVHEVSPESTPVATRTTEILVRARKRRDRVKPAGSAYYLGDHPSYQLVQQNKVVSSSPVWYKDVFWFCPTLVQKSFHRMLAVTRDGRILANSNTFVNDPIYFAPGYETRYGMMQGLASTFNEIGKRTGTVATPVRRRHGERTPMPPRGADPPAQPRPAA